MKLLYITASMPYGSAEAFFIPEARSLVAKGCELLIVPRSPSRDIGNTDAECLRAWCLRKPLISAEILMMACAETLCHPARTLTALSRLGKSRDLKTLLKNLAVFPKGLWLARVARKWKADHIHAHWATTTATMAMVAAELSCIPWSFTAHRGDIVDDNLLATKAQQAAFLRVISQSGRRLAESIAGKAVSEKAVVIRMGVPIPEHADQDRFDQRSDTLFCPANLLPVKGHRYLLQAIALLKAKGVKCTLEIAGDGPLRQQLQDLTGTLGIADRVGFLGHVPHEAIVARYRNGQVGAVVLASVDLGGGVHEGIPVALVEAMSYGVPVISTTTGGIPELLDGDAGLLVPPANPGALADAIEPLIQDASLRARLGQAGRSRVIEQHAVDRIVAALTARWAPLASPAWQSTPRARRRARNLASAGWQPVGTFFATGTNRPAEGRPPVGLPSHHNSGAWHDA